MENIARPTLDRKDFLTACRRIATVKGITTQYGSKDPEVQGATRIALQSQVACSLTCYTRAKVYDDDKITIVMSTCDGTMHITRKQFGSYSGTNPIIHCAPNGDAYRYHGEYVALINHVMGLVASL